MGPWSPPSGGLHLDGLLAWSAVQMAMQRDDTSEQTYADLIVDLPLDRHEFDDGQWVWKASIFHAVGWMGQSRQYMTQKTPAERMLEGVADGWITEKGGSTIDLQRGYAKNGQLFVTKEHAQGLRAWCVGDIDAVSEFLSHVKAVGVKTRMGMGTLRPYDDGSLFRVTPCDDAQTLWMRRNTPVQLIEGSVAKIGRWNAPYWGEKSYCWTPAEFRIPADVVPAPAVCTEAA